MQGPCLVDAEVDIGPHEIGVEALRLLLGPDPATNATES